MQVPESSDKIPREFLRRERLEHFQRRAWQRVIGRAFTDDMVKVKSRNENSIKLSPHGKTC
jgi:hypothetical protein